MTKNELIAKLQDIDSNLPIYVADGYGDSTPDFKICIEVADDWIKEDHIFFEGNQYSPIEDE